MSRTLTHLVIVFQIFDENPIFSPLNFNIIMALELLREHNPVNFYQSYRLELDNIQAQGKGNDFSQSNHKFLIQVQA